MKHAPSFCLAIVALIAVSYHVTHDHSQNARDMVSIDPTTIGVSADRSTASSTEASEAPLGNFKHIQRSLIQQKPQSSL